MRLYRDKADMYSFVAMPARNIFVLQADELVLTLAWSMLFLAAFVLHLDLFVLYRVEAVIYMFGDTMYRRKMRFFLLIFIKSSLEAVSLVTFVLFDLARRT